MKKRAITDEKYMFANIAKIMDKITVLWNGSCLFVPFITGQGSFDCCELLAVCNKGNPIPGLITEITKEAFGFRVTVKTMDEIKFTVHSNNVVIVRDTTHDTTEVSEES